MFLIVILFGWTGERHCLWKDGSHEHIFI